MDTPDRHLEALLALEARHDDLLARLAELDNRVQTVLAECMPTRESQASGGGNDPDRK
jgi:hypothetical protein